MIWLQILDGGLEISMKEDYPQIVRIIKIYRIPQSH